MRLTVSEQRTFDATPEPRTDSTRTQAEKVAIVDAAMAEAVEPDTPVCCLCRFELRAGETIIEGRDGIKWHLGCAED